MLSGGLSMGMMSSLVNLGTLILQTGINTLGTSVIVAHTAARKVFEIWGLPVTVLGATMATYSGQNYGAGKYDRITSGLKGGADAWLWLGGDGHDHGIYDFYLSGWLYSEYAKCRNSILGNNVSAG